MVLWPVYEDRFAGKPGFRHARAAPGGAPDAVRRWKSFMMNYEMASGILTGGEVNKEVAMAEEQAPKKKSKLKWIVLIFLLLMLGGAAAGWHFFLADKLNLPGGLGGGAAGTPAAAPAAPAARAGAPAMGATVPLPVFTVNLADPLGQRFIKLSVEVEVSNPKVVQELDLQKARVRDSIILLLSSKTYADIATMESKMLLKSEITDRLNTILGPGKISQVFITDMVIQ